MNYTRKLIFIFLACFVKALSGAQVSDCPADVAQSYNVHSMGVSNVSGLINLNLNFDQENKITKIKVTPNTTVKALMSYVNNHFDIKPDEQLLKYKRYDLNNRFLKLSDYGIQNGDDIYVFEIPKPLNQSLSYVDYILGFIQVNGSTYRLYVNPNFTIGELKKLINQQKYMTYAVTVNLFLAGQMTILNNNYKLKDVGIKDGSLIYVYPEKQLLK